MQRWTTVVMAMVVAACGGTAAVDSEAFTGADETYAASGDALSGSFAVGTVLETTANLNLRINPNTGSSVIRVIPQGDKVTLVASAPRSGWYNISFGGSKGWSYGSYLKLAAPGTGGGSGGGSSGGGTSAGLQGAVSRARSGVGFSYWWGHGRWQAGGASSSNAGSCTGSCPSCTHSGRNGADCSGYVAKAWSLGPTDISTDAHPYTTYNFRHETQHWTRRSRDTIREGDALVYNASGSGHIVLYAGGDRWGDMWTYEARGCRYGIVHNVRAIPSSYIAIARNGY